MTVGKHRKRLAPKQKKLLARIERMARTGAVHRLRGNIQQATRYERVVNSLAGEAELEHLSGAAFEREIKGQQAADRLYHKLVKSRR